jgi:activating signal cointegrator 1
MKAISLWQPWASLVVLGEKKIETRSWDTAYRGPLLIHAAKRQNIQELIMLCCNDIYATALRRCFNLDDDDIIVNALLEKMPFGCIIGKVDLVQTETSETIKGSGMLSGQEAVFGNYDDGRYGWELENPVLFEHPAAYKGSQGFFEVPCEIIGNTLNLLEVQR